MTAASNWDGPAERKRVRPALKNSYEALFHDVNIPRFLLTFRSTDHAAAALREPLLERAIGVIYRPETERASHYFQARLSAQFDAVLHFDETRAVEPLERNCRNGKRAKCRKHFPQVFRERESCYENERDSKK